MRVPVSIVWRCLCPHGGAISLRPIIMCCLVVWWRQEGLRWPDLSVMLPEIKAHSQRTSLWKRPDTISTYSQVAGFSFLPTHNIIQSSQWYPPIGNRVSPLFLFISFSSFLNFFYPHLRTFFSLVSERKEGTEEGTERNIDEREALIVSHMCPDQDRKCLDGESNLRPRHVPWSKIEPQLLVMVKMLQPSEPRQPGRPFPLHATKPASHTPACLLYSQMYPHCGCVLLAQAVSVTD